MPPNQLRTAPITALILATLGPSQVYLPPLSSTIERTEITLAYRTSSTADRAKANNVPEQLKQLRLGWPGRLKIAIARFMGQWMMVALAAATRCIRLSSGQVSKGCQEASAETQEP
jgi:hypothetical protein